MTKTDGIMEAAAAGTMDLTHTIPEFNYLGMLDPSAKPKKEFDLAHDTILGFRFSLDVYPQEAIAEIKEEILL